MNLTDCITIVLQPMRNIAEGLIKMHVTYHGHACMEITTGDQQLIIDPFINGNELSDVSVSEIQAQWILITHGHNDHIGDMIEIAKNNDATIIGMFEITEFAAKFGVKTHGMNIGGSFTFPFGKVTMVPALHSSTYEFAGEKLDMGLAAGFVIEAGGKTIYHAGDTGLFSDMKLLARYQLDLAFLPIGDNFTMGPHDAALAAGWIAAKKVVPIHYDTFPLIKQDPQNFITALADKSQGAIVHPGETIEI